MLKEINVGDKVELKWEFTSSQEFPDIYNVTYATCDGVFCTCKEMRLMFLKKYSKKPYYLTIDFENLSIVRVSGTSENQLFTKTFKKEITTPDWDLLFQIFQSIKYEYTEAYNENTDELPDFNQKKIEEGQLQGYPEIFYWDRNLHFSIDDNIYFAYDQYCLKNKCDCKEVAVQFFGTKNRKNLFKKYNEPGIRFNYETDTWKIEKNPKYLPHCHEVLVNKLKHEFPNILNIFKERHKKLNKMYRRFLKQTKFEPEIKNQEIKTKVGRNQACPCGSGKKYKKCCGKNI
jgi:SEC-C motif-containing protein